MSLAVRVALQHAEPLLAERAELLRARLQAEPTLWHEYLDVVRTLVAISPLLVPGASGELLTTAQLAEHLQIAPKTLLRRARAGQIMPAVADGKFRRWAGGATLAPRPARVQPPASRRASGVVE